MTGNFADHRFYLSSLNMIKVEFHCHTRYSKDSLVTLPALYKAAMQKDLQRVVITDHNAIHGALEGYKLDPNRFIAGEEIMTRQGELIGIFMKELIPPGLPAQKTIELLRQQGAFITVSHPFDSFREGGWEERDLLDILPYIDAIEVFNARCLYPRFNRRAKDFAHQHNLLEIVGSDSHSLLELGAATLTLPKFNDPESLKQALVEAQPHVHLSGPWVHFYSRYAAWRKKRLRKNLDPSLVQ